MARRFSWIVAAATAWAMTATADAATFTVNVRDEDASASCVADGPCSLRGAVEQANAAPGSTIVLPYVLGGYVVRRELEITADHTTITRGGTGPVDVHQAGSARVFLVRADGVEISGINVGPGHPFPPDLFDSGIGGVIDFHPTDSDAVLVLDRMQADGGRANAGGVIAQHGGLLMIFDSTIRGGRAPLGAGLYATDGAITLVDGSVFSGNYPATPDIAGAGGAIAMDGAYVAAVNSTFYGNHAGAGGSGSVFWLGDDSSLGLLHVTLASNGNGGAPHIAATGPVGAVNVTNSILGSANPTAPICALSGIPVVDDHSLSPDASCDLRTAVGSRQNVDPRFLPFGSYGGTTESVAFDEDSPAVDAANSDPTICPPIDQRYAPRPAGAGCDIGALESPYDSTAVSPPGGGGGGGGGGDTPSASQAPNATETPAPAPASAPTPAPATPPAPPRGPTAASPAPIEPTARLTRRGRLAVVATLPSNPRGAVTVHWTVRKGGRRFRGSGKVAVTGTTLAGSVQLPRRLRNATLVSAVATYRTTGGNTRSITL